MKHPKPRGTLQSMTHDQAIAAVCTGKAKLGAELAKHLAHKAHDGRQAYRCRQCGWFHIGNSIRPRNMRGSKNASHRSRNARGGADHLLELDA